MKTTSKKKKEIAVVVTTEHRGVFFGYTDPRRIDDEIVQLSRARLCLHWSADVRGFMGLAATGPSATCRIGPATKRLRLRGITSVIECDAAAVTAWEAAPWRG